MNFVGKNNYILCSTSACDLVMPKCTSAELFTILYLSEIFILEICLIFNVIAQPKIYNSFRYICCMPSLVVDHRTCVRKLESCLCVFIFICIYLALVASYCYFW
jgi:hypothetical protein